MGLHRKESRSFNGFGKILTKTIKITKTEIETKEKPQILHFQVKNTGFCQQSEKYRPTLYFFFYSMEITFFCGNALVSFGNVIFSSPLS